MKANGAPDACTGSRVDGRRRHSAKVLGPQTTEPIRLLGRAEQAADAYSVSREKRCLMGGPTDRGGRSML